MTEEKKNGFHIPSIHVTKDLLRRMRMPIAIVLLILLADQVLKIWIKTHMQIGESIPMLGDWFKIYFVENEGMAFGMAFGGEVGKIILTLFRIVASVGITWAIFYLVQTKARKLTIISVSMILAGAWAISSTVVFMVLSLTTAIIKWQSLCQKVADTPHFSKAEWWICYIFLLSTLSFQAGFH